MLFLALKDVQMVKITPHQIPTTPLKNYPATEFHIPHTHTRTHTHTHTHYGDSPDPLTLFGKLCQTWHDHPFRQRNKATKRAVRVEFCREGGLDKIGKKTSRQ